MAKSYAPPPKNWQATVSYPNTSSNPPTHDPENVAKTLLATRSMSRTAQLHKLTRWTIYRYRRFPVVKKAWDEIKKNE